MKSVSIFAVFATLTFLAFGATGAYAQQEIDPDHFDSPNTEPVPLPRTSDSKAKVSGYRGTFFLPYSALCNGRKLAPGKYSVSLRSNGRVGQATFNQKGHAIEIPGVVQTMGPKHHDEAVIVENNNNGPTLSAIRVRGFDFVFDRPDSAPSSQDGRRKPSERLPLTTIAQSETQAQAARKRLPNRKE